MKIKVSMLAKLGGRGTYWFDFAEGACWLLILTEGIIRAWAFIKSFSTVISRFSFADALIK